MRATHSPHSPPHQIPPAPHHWPLPRLLAWRAVAPGAGWGAGHAHLLCGRPPPPHPSSDRRGEQPVVRGAVGDSDPASAWADSGGVSRAQQRCRLGRIPSAEPQGCVGKGSLAGDWAAEGRWRQWWWRGSPGTKARAPLMGRPPPCRSDTRPPASCTQTTPAAWSHVCRRHTQGTGWPLAALSRLHKAQTHTPARAPVLLFSGPTWPSEGRTLSALISGPSAGSCSRAVRQLASLAPETKRGQSCKNFIAVQRFNVDSGVGGRQGASPGLRGRRLRSWASAPQRARREPRCRPRATARAAAGGREAQLSASLFGSAAWTQRFLARSCVGVGSRACIGTRRARGTWRT